MVGEPDHPASAPITVSDPDLFAWDDSADVVIVGFGGAGAVAAISARERDAEVIAVDSFGGGGATALSGGIVYAGATPYQREAGFEDVPDEMFKYLSLELGGAVSEATLQGFCEGSAGDLAWLERQGVGFDGSFYPKKASYPPPDKYLYFSGNEAIPGYSEKATPAPRGHRTLGKGWTGGVFYDALKQSALGKNVRFRPHAKARRLIVDGSGKVIGVELRELPEGGSSRQKHERLYRRVSPTKPFSSDAAEQATARARALEEAYGQARLIRARNGVILTAGGFIANRAMLAKHGPLYADNYAALMRMGSMGCDGSGIALGTTVGGATGYMDSLFVARNIAPPDALLQGLLVNSEGDRFINEESYGGFLGRAIGAQSQGKAWLIVSPAMFRRAIRQALQAGSNAFRYFSVPALLNLFFGGTRRASTIAALAQKCGIDPAGLRNTIEASNAACSAGCPDPLGKSLCNQAVIDPDGNTMAINMSIANRFAFTMVMSLGGLRVDEATGHVLNSDGRQIRGLFAAGRSAIGLCSHGYFSGMSLADCVFSGRRAGYSAALESEMVG